MSKIISLLFLTKQTMPRNHPGVQCDAHVRHFVPSYPPPFVVTTSVELVAVLVRVVFVDPPDVVVVTAPGL